MTVTATSAELSGAFRGPHDISAGKEGGKGCQVPRWMRPMVDHGHAYPCC